MAYGLRIGQTQFTHFYHNLVNRYGVMGKGKEIDFNKIKIIKARYKWTNHRIFVKAPNPISSVVNKNLYIVFNENLYINGGMPADFSSSDITFLVTGDIVEIQPYVSENSNYGARVNGNTIKTKDSVISSYNKISYNIDYAIDTKNRISPYGKAVHLLTLLEQCMKITWDANLDGEFELWRDNKYGDKYVIYTTPFYYDGTLDIEIYEFVK